MPFGAAAAVALGGQEGPGGQQGALGPVLCDGPGASSSSWGNSPEPLLPAPAPPAAPCARLISTITRECSNCRHLVGDFMIIVFCCNCAEHLGVSLLKEIKP